MAKKAEGIDVEKVRKLFGVLREIDAKHATDRAAVQAEIETLLGGGLSIGDLMKQAYAAFGLSWSTRYPGAYVWQFTKDAPQMKRLLLALGLEELRARFDRYVRNDDRFFVGARHSFGAFVSSVNQHAAPSEAPAGFTLDDDDRPVGCAHVPPCKDDVAHTRRKVEEMRSGHGGSHSGPTGDVL